MAQVGTKLRIINALHARLDRMKKAAEASQRPSPNSRHGALKLSGLAVERCIDGYDFATVLDIGSGAAKHADAFEAAGKTVTRFDFGKSRAFTDTSGGVLIGDFVSFDCPQRYDLTWASHVLEHTIHTHAFLEKMAAVTTPDTGIVAITVPPAKSAFVGGHVMLWTPALLIYRLVLAGFDCSNAECHVYGYNISVIVPNRRTDVVLDKLAWDLNDIERLQKWFPDDVRAQTDGARFGTVYNDARINFS